MSEATVFLKIAAKYVGDADLKKLKADLGEVKQASQSWWDVMKGILAADILKSLARSAINFAKDCVNAFMESEEAVNRLSVALKNNGTHSQTLLREYQRFAQEMQRTTTYNDEQVLSIMSLLSTYGMVGTTLERVTKLTLNFADSQRIDTQTATMLLAKAYEGNTTALGKMGIEIDKTGDKGRDFESVLLALEKRSGSAASAELDTFAGAWKRLKNMWDEAMESLGGKLVPTMKLLVQWLEYQADKYGIIIKRKEEWKYLTDDEIKQGRKMAEVHGVLSQSYLNYEARMKTLNETRKKANELVMKAVDAEKALQLQLENTKKTTKETAIVIGESYGAAFTEATRAGASFAEALEAGLTAAAHSALRVVKNYLLKQLEAFYEAELAKIMISSVANKGANLWQLGVVTGQYMAGVMAINAVIPYAKGGIITQPTVALMGEAGAEMVVPLEGQNSRDFMSQMGSVNVSINAGMFLGNKVTAMETAKMIGDLLTKAKAKGVISRI
jgi:hypothetical protein